MAAAIRIALAGALLLAAPAGAAEGGESALRDIGFRVLNVLMLLALLLYFARKPIQNFFSERRNRIRDEIKQASELRREAEERHSKWQRRLVDLEAELESIRGAARERAEREREQILADARAAAQRIQSDAHMAIDRDMRRAVEQLRSEAADLAVELAGEMLAEKITADDRERLLDEFIARIESADAAGQRR
ncbi:MAG: F0F1 ATP synthase subunit B [Myxococcales bacterium]|nr:F0F1 ATP synthase subunit B [Myxococcales bacterium]MDH5565639.1 F0F1 ATP synthase subunit B [Myxococcales bacterium]